MSTSPAGSSYSDLRHLFGTPVALSRHWPTSNLSSPPLPGRGEFNHPAAACIGQGTLFFRSHFQELFLTKGICSTPRLRDTTRNYPPRTSGTQNTNRQLSQVLVILFPQGRPFHSQNGLLGVTHDAWERDSGLQRPEKYSSGTYKHAIKQ